MKFLVTGAAGFIGSQLASALLDRGDEVVGIDSLNDYYERKLKFDRLAELGVNGGEDGDAAEWGKRARSGTRPGFTFIRMRLEDGAALSELVGSGAFDRVVNLAAQAGVRYSIENPRAYGDSNLIGFLNVLEACRAAKTPHLVYASSSSVYGLNASRPFRTDEGVDHPVSLYAATKKANELMAHAYSHLYGLPTTGLRFFTVYGPWGRPDMAYFKFALAALRGQAIDVYNHGNMLRDFTYINDIVKGVMLCADAVPQGDPAWDPTRPRPSRSSAPYRLYNIGNNSPERLSRFIEVLENALGTKIERRYLPMQSGDVYATEADIDDLASDFGWRPDTPLEKGLSAFAAWFIARYGKIGGGRSA